MTDFTRRTLVKGGTAFGAAGALTGPALLDWAKAWAQAAPWKPEKGAKLSMLRWKYFVQAEDDAFVKLIAAFYPGDRCCRRYLPRVVRRRAAESLGRRQYRRRPRPVLGSVFAAASLPAEVPDVTDVADYLGKAHGGWVDSAVKYGKSGNKWIAIPICYSGALINYRIEASKKAGFSTFPTKTDEFLEYAKAMKAQGTPVA